MTVSEDNPSDEELADLMNESEESMRMKRLPAASKLVYLLRLTQRVVTWKLKKKPSAWMISIRS